MLFALKVGGEMSLGGDDMGEGTYKAAMRTVFWPDILGVNLAPMVQMSFLRYSRASPV